MATDTMPMALQATKLPPPGAAPRCPTPLSRLEQALWRYLQAHRGRTVSRAELLRQVWGLNPESIATRTVDMHVAKLRKKLAPLEAHDFRLSTVRGAGYRLCVADFRSFP